MFFKGILCVIFVYLLFYMAGFLFTLITKQEQQKNKIVFGSVIVIALFEIVSLFCFVFKSNFSVLYVSFLILTIIIFGSAVCFFVKKQEWKNIFENKSIKRDFQFVYVLFCLTVLLQIVIICFMHFNSYDDGFYIAISNIALEQNAIELKDQVVYCGNNILEDFSSRPGINCWELLIAFFSKLFAVHPAVLSHTFLPVLLLPLCYMAVDQVMEKLTDSLSNRYLGLFIYSLLVMFYGNGYLLSSYLAVGTWTGKALLFHLVIPLLLSECIDVVKDEQTRTTWSRIGIIAVAGVGVTATGIYTIPIYLFSIAVPYILYLLYERDSKKIFLLLRKAVLSLGIFILIGFYAVIEMFSGGNNVSATGEEFEIKRIYTKALFQNKVIVILFVLSLLLMLCMENSKKIKLLFAGQTLTLFLLVLNPVTAGYIAKNVTGISVYWRMFLLLPVPFLLSLGGTYITKILCGGEKLLQISKRKVLSIISAAFTMILLINGKGMFSIFSLHQNMYMIPQEILAVCESFDLSSKEMITVLVEEPMNRFLRQYSSYFDVIIGRSASISRCREEEEYKMLCASIYEEGEIDSAAREYLEKFGVEYIVSEDQIKDSELKVYKKTADYFIYEVK